MVEGHTFVFRVPERPSTKTLMSAHPPMQRPGTRKSRCLLRAPQHLHAATNDRSASKDPELQSLDVPLSLTPSHAHDSVTERLQAVSVGNMPIGNPMRLKRSVSPMRVGAGLRAWRHNNSFSYASTSRSSRANTEALSMVSGRSMSGLPHNGPQSALGSYDNPFIVDDDGGDVTLAE